MLFQRTTLPKVLLFLAAFVFFSANTVYFLEADAGTLNATATAADSYHFDFDHIRNGAPRLNTKSALLVDYDNGQVLYAKGRRRCPAYRVDQQTRDGDGSDR